MKVDEEEQDGGEGGAGSRVEGRGGAGSRVEGSGEAESRGEGSRGAGGRGQGSGGAGKLRGRRASLQSSPQRNTASVFPAEPSLKVPLKRLNYTCFSV